jgi:hypothetical protein
VWEAIALINHDGRAPRGFHDPGFPPTSHGRRGLLLMKQMSLADRPATCGGKAVGDGSLWNAPTRHGMAWSRACAWRGYRGVRSCLLVSEHLSFLRWEAP